MAFSGNLLELLNRTPVTTEFYDTEINKQPRGFPAGPVVRVLSFYCKAQGFAPGQKTKIPHATWCDENKTRAGQGRQQKNGSRAAQSITHFLTGSQQS